MINDAHAQILKHHQQEQASLLGSDGGVKKPAGPQQDPSRTPAGPQLDHSRTTAGPHIRECDVPPDGLDLIPLEHSLTWWNPNPKPRHTKCLILTPSLISSPHSELLILMLDLRPKG
jgi:hypothetical protein